MMLNFDDITWHDTEILKITIDRSNPGKEDTIEFKLRNESDGQLIVTFIDAWRMICDLNFGIVCRETIRTASCHDSHEVLDELRKRWGRPGINLSGLKLFDFETNSTASKIRIIARAVRIVSSA